MILIVWVLSALISIPPLFGWGRASKMLEINGSCMVSQDFKYQIYATLLAFYVPLIVMIILNIIILRTAKKLREKEIKNCVPLKQKRSSITALIVSKMNLRRNSKSFSAASNRSSLEESSNNNNSYIVNIKKNSRSSRSICNVFSGFKRDSKASQGKNEKASKTLGIIMGLFIVCWLPFFLLALLKPIPIGDSKSIMHFIPEWLDSFLLWLGYSNSALNPIIYAMFNKDFRRPFIELLCFRCCTINEKLRDIKRKKMFVDEFALNNKINVNKTISDKIREEENSEDIKEENNTML